MSMETNQTLQERINTALSSDVPYQERLGRADASIVSLFDELKSFDSVLSYVQQNIRADAPGLNETLTAQSAFMRKQEVIANVTNNFNKIELSPKDSTPSVVTAKPNSFLIPSVLAIGGLLIVLAARKGKK